MRIASLSLALVLVAASPAAAISVDPSEPSGSHRTSVEDRPGIDGTAILDPRVAAGLAIAPSVVLTGLLSAFPAGSPLSNLTFLVPFSFGLGHVYAGDPLRAGLVTLGGPIAMLGGAGVGAIAGLANGGAMGGPLVGLGAWTAGTFYGGWAAWDAYRDAERQNARFAPGTVYPEQPSLQEAPHPLGAH